MHQIIQLQPDDDIASIRARLDAADLSHIVLVIPRGCVALESERGMQLLRRAAEDSGAELALVVHDPEIRERAATWGFPVFHSITQAQRTRWHMETIRNSKFEIRNSEIENRKSKVESRYAEHVVIPADRVRQWRGTVVALIVLACVLCTAVTLFVPAANVRLVPASTALTLSTDLLADPTTARVNVETRSVPARRLTREISGSAQLKTTTQKNIPDARATGTVIFSNLRTQETTVPQGTVVKTSAGVPIRFTTTTSVTLPAGINSRAEVPIQALDPGPAGNVKELAINTIEGALNLEARVINLKPTVSGNVKAVKVVTADDKKKLEALLLQQLREQGASLLQKELKPNQFLPPASVLIDVSDQLYDHGVDDPADVLNLRITAVAFGLAVDQEDVEALARQMLQKQMQVGAGLPRPYQLLPDGVQVEALSGGKYQGVALRLPIRVVGYATPQIDTDKVSRALQGKPADEAADYLSNAIPLAQPPDLNITPLGWNRMPWFGFRIAVFVETPPVSRK